MSARPSVHPTGYDTPDRMWTALTSHLKTIAPATQVAELHRRFVYDRFLARVFTHAPQAWVLKGGTALLARVHDARHSSDVDLNRISGTLHSAVAELEAASRLNLNDHVQFTAEPTRPIQYADTGAQLRITPYVGVRPVHPFKVDVVVNSLITVNPDHHTPTPVVTMRGMDSPPYRLYPVVDHIADKVCATMELYGAAKRPSSRSRDLVDLVVFACTHDVDARDLRRAIEGERHHRNLPPIPAWSCPAGWAAGYKKDAATVPHCAQHRDFAAANTLVAAFLDPVLTDRVGAARWSHEARQWRPLPW